MGIERSWEPESSAGPEGETPAGITDVDALATGRPADGEVFSASDLDESGNAMIFRVLRISVYSTSRQQTNVR